MSESNNSNESAPQKDERFVQFLERLNTRRQEVLPKGLEEYRLHVVTNFELSQKALYEQAITQHHGGRLYGDKVILKVLTGHAQAQNGAYLDENQYATLVAYFKPATTNRSDPLYDEERGFSEKLHQLREQIKEHLESLGEDTGRLEAMPKKNNGFTYDLSAFWSTFEQVKKAYGSGPKWK